MDSITESTSDDAELTTELTDMLQRTHGYMAKRGGPGKPSLHLLTAGYNFARTWTSANPPGADFNASLIELASDTLDVSSEFIYDACDTLREHLNAGGTNTIGPFAIAANDYPGTEEGWPRANEPPLFNAVVLVPAALKPEFARFAAGGYSNFESVAGRATSKAWKCRKFNIRNPVSNWPSHM